MDAPVLSQELRFPDPRFANEEGLVAVGGDFSVERLLLAYRSGIFPWTTSPITWWSPEPRAVFEPGAFHVPRSLARVIRHGTYAVTLDRAFREVIESCAAPAVNRRTTWISGKFVSAYTRLHELGHAHSIECWLGGELVGGVYGVSVGGLFAGESMFHLQPNASKVALYHLVRHLERRGFVLFDIQMLTPITKQLGATTIPRKEYLQRLAVAVTKEVLFTPTSGPALI
jgi:leucyl/phenylalanyl-tRNA--protein transferase